MRRLDTADPGFEPAFVALLAEARETTDEVDGAVRAIIADIRARGDAALLDYTSRFDRLDLTVDRLRVAPDEIDAAVAGIPPDLAAALDLAADRIEAFHRAQRPTDLRTTDAAGLTLGMRWTALDAVGLYVPGGKAAYPSSVLMNAIPARVAGVAGSPCACRAPTGCSTRWCSPPRAAPGSPRSTASAARRPSPPWPGAPPASPRWIASSDRATPTWPRPSGKCSAASASTASPAPPRSSCWPTATTIRASSRSTCWPRPSMTRRRKPSSSPTMPASRTGWRRRFAAEIPTLPRAAIAGASWLAHGAVILVRDWDEAVALVDRLAPEHLQIMVQDPEAMFARVRHAGAAFLGRFCPEAVGDYVAGPNHVLPTGRSARFASGLSVFDFLKRTTWVAADAQGLAAIGPAAVRLAEAEGLQAHGRSIALRLDRLRSLDPSRPEHHVPLENQT